MGRLTYSPSGANVVTGVASPAANNITSIFNIPHGLGKVPRFANAVAANTLTNALYFVTYDATNIIVTFALAPTTGTLAFNWMAVV